MKTAEIRRRYLDFFVRHGHTEVASTSLVHNDPSLLFVVAGMVPMVPYFTGVEPAPWPRAVSCQKCIRTLDIEEVGKTTRHGTFFQMLGNFSFGDYFKAEIIAWSWEFLTGSVADGNLGIDPERISVSVLGAGFHPAYPDGDVEARELWRAIGLPDDRIHGRNLTENYWHMGVPGPGGPDSEIFFDRGPEFGEAGGPDVNDERYLEIWNNVFQQEELSAVRGKDDFDVLRPLPTKNIDTGAGLERIATLLQGKQNLYEIDEVYPVLAKAAELAGKTYGANAEDDVRMRVVADHVRSALMLIGDGVVPGNEGRGYVLRRLLRRVVRSMRLLGVSEPSFGELFPVSRDAMVESYPEVGTDFDRIAQIAGAEEEAFTRTLSAGTQIFDTAVSDVRSAGSSTLSGERAFQLHDTYGFPIDLTLEMAQEQGLEVDQAGFTALMDQQRQRAKADARSKKGGGVANEAYRQLRDLGETRFTGYSELTGESRVRGIIADGSVAERAVGGDTVEIVLEESPFYAESGGQDADTGLITGDGVSLRVTDVQRPVNGLVVHTVEVVDGELVPGAEVATAVDGQARLAACQAHSATHLVHAALRQVLGPTAVQAGSYNRPGYLRFDYSWNAQVGKDIRDELEAITNRAVRDDLEVSAREMGFEEAKRSGAMALFGENYGDRVRVISIADDDYPENWSKELCGGTHVQRSSQIGLVSFIGEGSVGSGARRIEAFTGYDAFNQLARERALVAGLSETLKVQPDQLGERVTKLVSQLKEADKEIARLRAERLRSSIGELVDGAHDMWGLAYVGHHLDGVAAGEVRQLATDLRDRFGDRAAVVALVGGTAEKPAVVVATNQPARDRGLSAGDLVREASTVLGGKGGGRPDIAQGGGSDASKVPAALQAVEHAVGHVLQNA
ncbi:MAG TPA: alanine--tRNA ligase [Candidatus Avipropionibacterium avicola]|uniref:Alanine--tRNA ligase n=1 Tax=Candidatus Avipropionibacterium avicola TaxID=2840701 RepID=A0A9D1GYJ0_9ACTN|nr:alanine--tRNA ligase [Candidatus Avipropionibacterium avicola]